MVISDGPCPEFSSCLKERSGSGFVTEPRNKVSDETRANETAKGEPTMIHGNKTRIGKLLTRYWAEAVVVAIVILLWAPRLSGPIDLRWDAGVYYVLGTSLATGHGYRILSEPGSPEALQYPPLLPAVVALYQRALGSTDPAVVAPWLRISYAALFLAYAVAMLALARRYLRPGFAVMAMALCLLQVNTIFLSDLLFTEIPFVLISVVFVLVAVDGPLASRPLLREIASFVLAAAGFLLRTAGVALLAAWVFEALARRRWRLALTRCVLAVLPIIAWETHVARVRASYEYAHPAYDYQRAPYHIYNASYVENIGLIGDGHVHPRALTAHLGGNLGPILNGLGEAISTTEYYWRQLLLKAQQRLLGRQVIPLGFVLVPIISLALLVMAGIGTLACRRAWLMVFIILVSVALMCTTPWPDQFQRYLMPLAPFLTIGAMLVVARLYAALSAASVRPTMVTFGRIALIGLVLLALILQIYAGGSLFYDRASRGASFVRGRGAVGPRFFYYGMLWRGWDKAIAWIEEHSAPSAIVLTRAPHLCYLDTGRRAVLPPVESNPDRVRHLLESVPVSYVILDFLDSLPAVETDRLGWHRVQFVDGTRLYERSSSAP